MGGINHQKWVVNDISIPALLLDQRILKRFTAEPPHREMRLSAATRRLFGIDGHICVVHAGHAVVSLRCCLAAACCCSWGQVIDLN